jgi:quercetin dioxygenase-like cupin family protein
MIQDKFSLIKISDDIRGVIYELKQSELLQLKFLTLQKGYARGGHSHPYPERFFLLSGRVEFHIGSMSDEIVQEYDGGDTVTIEPDLPHYVVALTDSVFVEITSKGQAYEVVNYTPFRSIVEKLMGTR